MFEQEDNVFNNEQQTVEDEGTNEVTYTEYGFFRTDPPEEISKGNCNGHNTSILNGGLGHSVGDKCRCDNKVDAVPVDGWIPFLILFAVLLIATSKRIIKS